MQSRRKWQSQRKCWIQPTCLSPSLDDNNYAFGSINGINIVIACLPDGNIEKVSATTVAKDLQRSFPSIRIYLIVGIGGGVPRQKQQDKIRGDNDTPASGSCEEDDNEDGDLHVRMGDVVASRPVGTNGGVVEYDFEATVWTPAEGRRRMRESCQFLKFTRLAIDEHSKQA